MIQELPEQRFSKILPIAAAAPQRYPEALSVLLGVNPGRVYVDDVDTPTAALIWAQGIEGFYLVGDAGSPVFSVHLDAYVRGVIKPEARKSGLDWFEVSGDSPVWDEAIQSIFKDQRIGSSRQIIHSLPQDQSTVDRLRSVNRRNVQRIDLSLLNDSRIENLEFLQSKLKRCWRSSEEFLDTGIGYVILLDDLVVSACFSEFVAEDIHVLGVETISEKRRQGFAKMATGAVLLECCESGLQPYWDCEEVNTGSRKLVESLGFEKERDYLVHYFEFDRHDEK